DGGAAVRVIRPVDAGVGAVGIGVIAVQRVVAGVAAQHFEKRSACRPAHAPAGQQVVPRASAQLVHVHQRVGTAQSVERYPRRQVGIDGLNVRIVGVIGSREEIGERIDIGEVAASAAGDRVAAG